MLQTAEALDEAFEGSISGEEMNTVLTGSLTKISVSKFRAVVKDSFYIESFSFPSPGEIDFKTPQVINFYRTEQSTASILERSVSTLGDWKNLTTLLISQHQRNFRL